MGEAILYHKPNCSVSNRALNILRENGIKVKIIYYLENPLSQEKLKILLNKLKMDAIQLVRTKEPVYKEKFAGKEFSNEKWIEILAANPVLMERPILVKGRRAVLGRPAENVLKLFKT